MTNIPRILNCAAVKLFAVLDTTPSPHRSRTTNPDLSRIAQLAICRSKRNSRFPMFSCDDNWKTLRTELFDSIEAAMRHAENLYPGISEKWISPAEAVSIRERGNTEKHCMLCGETHLNEHNSITGDHAYVCYNCINRLYLQIHPPIHKTKVAG